MSDASHPFHQHRSGPYASGRVTGPAVGDRLQPADAAGPVRTPRFRRVAAAGSRRSASARAGERDTRIALARPRRELLSRFPHAAGGAAWHGSGYRGHRRRTARPGDPRLSAGPGPLSGGARTASRAIALLLGPPGLVRGRGAAAHAAVPARP